MTSTYFEGQAEGNGLARRGYSRDHRGDCKQVCIGLVVTRDGVPLGYEVFAGNRTDVTTVEEIVTTMERSSGQARRVWVMDRGMASAENIAWLRGGQRLYVIGASKSELKKFAGELADRRNWRQVRDGVEAKVCAGPDGSETFLLVRSAERQQKEQAMHARISRAHRDRPGEPATTHRTGAKADRPRRRRASNRTPARPQLARRRAAHAIRLVDDPILPAGLRLEWPRRAEWDDWSRHNEGCYVLAPICATGAPRRCGGPISSFPKRKRPFASIKASSSIRPIWHQREDRVLPTSWCAFSPTWLVEDDGAMAEPRRSRQQSAHPPPGTRRHHQHRCHPADGGASRPRTAIALRRAPRPRPSGLARAPRSPLARTTPHAPHGEQNVVPTFGVKYLKSLARATDSAEVGLARTSEGVGLIGIS